MPVTAPTSAFILAVYTARAGHRSGKIAVIVSEPLLLATIVVTLLYGGWIGLAVTAVVAVLVLAWTLSRRIAVVVSGLLLLATLVFSAWQSGGWINVAVIAMTAVLAVLVFVWARSRNKPPPGPDGAQREGPPAATAPPGASGRSFVSSPSLAPSSLTLHVPPSTARCLCSLKTTTKRASELADAAVSKLPGRSDGSAAGHHPQPDKPQWAP